MSAVEVADCASREVVSQDEAQQRRGGVLAVQVCFYRYLTLVRTILIAESHKSNVALSTQLSGLLLWTWRHDERRSASMFQVFFAFVRRFSTNKSSAVLNSQMARLHKLGHKKDARQLESRQQKTLRRAVDKQLRMEDRLKGVRH